MQIKTVELVHVHLNDSWPGIFEEEDSRNDRLSPRNIFSAPVFLQSEVNGYKVLYGFGEIRTLQKSKAQTVPAFVIPRNVSFASALNIVADFVLHSRPAWPVEVARCLAECQKHNVTTGKKSNLFKKLTGSESTAALEERYLALNRLDPLLIQFLIEKKAPLKTWFLATELPVASQNLAQKIVTESRPTLSLFEEICRNLLDIYRREATEPAELLTELQNIVDSEAGSSSEKIEILRMKLQEHRFPHLTQHRQEVLGILEKIKLPTSTRIDYDKNFEDQSLSISARIKTADDLEKFREFINGPAPSQLKQLVEKL